MQLTEPTAEMLFTLLNQVKAVDSTLGGGREGRKKNTLLATRDSRKLFTLNIATT